MLHRELQLDQAGHGTLGTSVPVHRKDKSKCRDQYNAVRYRFSENRLRAESEKGEGTAISQQRRDLLMLQRLKLSSQHPHQVSLNGLSVQRIQWPLLVSHPHVWAYTHTHTQTHTHTNTHTLIKIFLYKKLWDGSETKTGP